MMYPKPPKPVRGTPDAKTHMGLVGQLGCMCCGAHPVQLHHVIMGRFSQSRASDFETIPLCARHHDMLHTQRAAWRAAYGDDVDMLPTVARLVANLKQRTV